MACFLNRTPRFHCYVVWRGSKSKHHKDTCLNEIGQCLQILITTLHSIMNTIGRTYLSNQGIHTHALLITITKSRKVRFQSNFNRCFIIYLVMQHEFSRVNLIGRSWRTWKTSQITPTCLKEVEQCLHILVTILHSIVTQPRGPMYPIKKSTNMHFW